MENNLPNDVTEVKSINIFKKLDKHW